MPVRDAKHVLDDTLALALDIERTFSGAKTDVQSFPSGGVILDVRRGGRLFVLAYIPSSDLYGVDEVLDGDGFGDHYRFVSKNFDQASERLRHLLHD